MSEREPSWEELEDYLRGCGWTGEWKHPKLGVFCAPDRGYRLRLDSSRSIDIAIAGIADAEGRESEDVKRDIMDGPPELQKTEAKPELETVMSIIDDIGREGLNALENLRFGRANTEAAGKNPRQSSVLKVLAAELDAYATALGLAMLRRGEKLTGNELPEGYAGQAKQIGMKRLHYLRVEAEKEQEAMRAAVCRDHRLTQTELGDMLGITDG